MECPIGDLKIIIKMIAVFRALICMGGDSCWSGRSLRNQSLIFAREQLNTLRDYRLISEFANVFQTCACVIIA